MTAPLTYDQQIVLQAKYDKLLEAVARMRHFQLEWDKWHSSSDRERKKIWEREVDAQLKKEHKERKSKQSEIF